MSAGARVPPRQRRELADGGSQRRAAPPGGAAALAGALDGEQLPGSGIHGEHGRIVLPSGHDFK